MAVAPEGIANEQQLEVGVNGPDGANRLFVDRRHGGVHPHAGRGERPGVRHTPVPRRPTLAPGQFIRAAATASLAGIANGGLANNAQWAVDSVDADLVVADTDGYLQRIGFQVNILAQL